ncbi:hypothetical protein Q5P01_021825 [Channa striata]|uniref:G-protein coupled receptors family 1 profile domain-containing protein n=1 Tax=Channa striata TaxID=64152 RepID=A0AA88LUV4_CHASR|nr:hypothetical protein Q5P01_021825 [Channa striata]
MGLYILIWTIISISLPVTLVAIYAVYSLVQKENVAPIYVINLLISDLIQLCSMTVFMIRKTDIISETFYYIYYFGVLASVGFMACVSLESQVLCDGLCCGLDPSSCLLLSTFFLPHLEVIRIIAGVYLLVPFPLFIFSLCGTLKALSAASRVPPDEKRRIVAMLVLVLLIYTLLFMPSIIGFLAANTRNNIHFTFLPLIFLFFSPLADSFLYVLLRKGAVDKVLASVCCCRMESNDVNRSTELSEVNVHT